MASELSTTSYSILGLLALRSWTTYELAEQMDRALGHFWPRAASVIYEEPKRLVASGHAKATLEHVGKRPRTRYAITPKGRRALRAWVPTPSPGPVVEFEALVKVFFAEHGTREDLLATIDGVRAWVEQRGVDSLDIPKGYLEQRGGFPERLPWLVLTGRLLGELDQALDRWATWATHVVESWPEDLRQAEPEWSALEEMDVHNRLLARRAALRSE
jgi:PadR family transcriptional regulator AphA